MPGGNLSYVKKLIFTALIVFALCFGAATAAQADVVINELMTDNGVFDQNGEAYDWIELFNDGNEAVDLSGYGLSDKKVNRCFGHFRRGRRSRWADTSSFIAAAKTKMRTDREKNIYYAPFKLGVDGETICLSDPAGNLLDTLSYPAQYGNVSYGRLSKTGEYGFFNVSTPQSANDG